MPEIFCSSSTCNVKFFNTSPCEGGKEFYERTKGLHGSWLIQAVTTHANPMRKINSQFGQRVLWKRDS